MGCNNPTDTKQVNYFINTNGCCCDETTSGNNINDHTGYWFGISWVGFLAKILSATIYFAHFYAAGGCGENENTNRLIRQYLSIGTDINRVTDEQIKQAMDQLNNPKLIKLREINHIMNYFGGGN